MRHVVFDLETTSVDVNTCRIVQMAFVTLNGENIDACAIDPGIPIPAGASKVHGITDAMVADCQTFEEVAPAIQIIVNGATLCGYNSRRFDVPVLDRHLREAGQPGIDLSNVQEIDAHQAWIKMRPRTLSGACQEFLGDELSNAHDAVADAVAAARVIKAMAMRCEEGLEGLMAMSKPAHEIDRAGKFKRCPETGRAILNIGKHRGEFAASYVGFLSWMLDADFPEETKQHIRGWLNK